VPIHYRGGGPAMQDLVSGQVQVMLIQGGGSIAQHVKSGKLTALAVSTATRSSFYPDLPAIAETYPGFETVTWNGLFAPAGTPQIIIDRLSLSIRDALKDGAFLDRLAKMGVEPVPTTPAEFAAEIRSEYAMWRDVIKAAGLLVEQ